MGYRNTYFIEKVKLTHRGNDKRRMERKIKCKKQQRESCHDLRTHS